MFFISFPINVFSVYLPTPKTTTWTFSGGKVHPVKASFQVRTAWYYSGIIIFLSYYLIVIRFFHIIEPVILKAEFEGFALDQSKGELSAISHPDLPLSYATGLHG
jgi:hypothetical protein